MSKAYYRQTKTIATFPLININEAEISLQTRILLSDNFLAKTMKQKSTDKVLTDTTSSGEPFTIWNSFVTKTDGTDPSFEEDEEELASMIVLLIFEIS